MKVNLDIEVTFSMPDDELSEQETTDLFLFVKSDFNDNEVDFVGLSYEQVLKSTFEEIKDAEERKFFKEKIRSRMFAFLAKLDDYK